MSIDCENVAKVFDVGVAGPDHYIVMEYILGWALGDVVRAFRSAGRPVPIDVAARLIDGALSGLDVLHNAKDPETGASFGFVHRDIAPKNMMTDAEGRCRLIDLGIGMSDTQTWTTRTGIAIGTPTHMAPEQALGRPVDQRTDVYAMGLALYELIAGRRFNLGTDRDRQLLAAARPVPRKASEGRSDVSKALEDVIQQALAVEMDERFASARAMREALMLAVPNVGAGNLAAAMPKLMQESLRKLRTHTNKILSTPLPEPDVSPMFEAIATAPGVSRPQFAPPVEVDTSETADTASTAIVESPLRSSRAPVVAAVGIACFVVGLAVTTSIPRGEVEPTTSPTPAVSAKSRFGDIAAPGAVSIPAATATAAIEIAGPSGEEPSTSVTPPDGVVPTPSVEPPRRRLKTTRSTRRGRAPRRDAGEVPSPEPVLQTSRLVRALDRLRREPRDAHRVGTMIRELRLWSAKLPADAVQARSKVDAALRSKRLSAFEEAVEAIEAIR